MTVLQNRVWAVGAAGVVALGLIAFSAPQVHADGMGVSTTVGAYGGSGDCGGWMNGCDNNWNSNWNGGGWSGGYSSCGCGSYSGYGGTGVGGYSGYNNYGYGDDSYGNGYGGYGGYGDYDDWGYGGWNTITLGNGVYGYPSPYQGYWGRFSVPLNDPAVIGYPGYDRWGWY